MRVHVVGNACIDTTFRVPRLPGAGETLNACGSSDELGGKGANQAVAAARTGAAVTFWTALGSDAKSATISDELARYLGTVEVSRFGLDSDRSSVVVNPSGENFIVSSVACAIAFDPLSQTRLADVIMHGDIVVMQGNLTGRATSACLRLGRALGARTILNASPVDPTDLPDLGCADVIVVNRQEAEALTGRPEPRDAASALAVHGAGLVVVTLGAEGCVVLDASNPVPRSYPALPVQAIDTSGAGDVFCGCIAGGLAMGLATPAAIDLAMAAAALSTTRPGTVRACPSRTEMAGIVRAARSRFQ